MCAGGVHVRVYVCGVVPSLTDAVCERSRTALRALRGSREVRSVEHGGSTRVVGFMSVAKGATSFSLL